MSFQLYDQSAILATSKMSYWAAESHESGLDVIEVPDAELAASVVSIVFSRTAASGIVEDFAVTRLALTRVLLNDGCELLDDSEMAAAESPLNTWWGSLKVLVSTHWTLSKYVWHAYEGLSTSPGPARRTTTVNVAATGSGTNTMPDQVATSVTFKTAYPRHWGRMYLPPLTVDRYTQYGRLSTASCDAIGSYYETLLESLDTVDVGGTGVTPIVRSSSGGGLLSIDKVQVDDTPDVIRSRRVEQTTYRKVVDA